MVKVHLLNERYQTESSLTSSTLAKRPSFEQQGSFLNQINSTTQLTVTTNATVRLRSWVVVVCHRFPGFKLDRQKEKL